MTEWMELIFVQPWPWWVSGPAVGLVAVGMLWSQRKPLGASATYTDLTETFRRGNRVGDEMDLTGAEDEDPVSFHDDPRERTPRWRLWMLAGLFLGGAAGWAGGGEATGSFELPGMAAALGLPLYLQIVLLFGGGILIGAGTRMSGGCTSGHAITGISARQLPSLYATCVFFAVGMAVSFAMAWLAGGLS